METSTKRGLVAWGSSRVQFYEAPPVRNLTASLIAVKLAVATLTTDGARAYRAGTCRCTLQGI